MPQTIWGASNMTYIWLFIAVGMMMFEALTAQLVAVWFAIGAIVTMLLSYTGIETVPQIWLFLIVSGATLFLVRPIARKAMKNRTIKTNVDILVGMIGVVTISINNLNGQGRIKVNNSDWAAYSDDGTMIEVGEKVLVKSVVGVKLVVEPAK